DEKGEVLERNEDSTDEGSVVSKGWMNKIIAQINDVTDRYAKGKAARLSCGISAPGLVDKMNRKILHMPERLQGIENFDWSLELKRDVRVLNDGHSACLAEFESFYKSEGIKNMLMLTLGTGVGGGIIIDGRLYQGNLQRAGHVGHMTVQYDGAPTMTNMPGSLEHAMGNFSVSERTKGEFKSVRELVDAYEKGNAKAKEWWLESVRKLAIALASLNNILSPECIVLGGGITEGAGNSLLQPLNDFMSLYEWRPGGNKIKIALAQHGRYAGAIGAAFFAKNSI
ncbi:MAG: ROK family protein, partial [Pricia sp.]|nr:ROK family protein [Pricia sp.]